MAGEFGFLIHRCSYEFFVERTRPLLGTKYTKISRAATNGILSQRSHKKARRSFHCGQNNHKSTVKNNQVVVACGVTFGIPNKQHNTPCVQRTDKQQHIKSE
jgi:hypothetical protein